MTCQNCGQDNWVSIGVKKYCTQCGSLQRVDPIIGGINSVDGPAAAHAEPAVAAPAPVAPRPAVSQRPVSAQSLHGTSALASGGVLDLRQTARPQPVVASTPRPASFTDIALKPTSIVQPMPQPPAAPAPAPIQTPGPAPEPPRPQPSLHEIAAQLSNTSSPSEAAQQAKEKKNVGKPLSVGAAVLAVVIMSGYIWMNNYNNLSIRTASQRAGIIASLPHYTPTGYKLNGPISYGNGFVSFNLRDTKNVNNSVAVIQRRSDWDSSSLLELYVTPKSKDYVAVDTQGLKIYLFGNSQATWVNHGVQYVVQANSSLNRDQIVKLAEGL